MTSKELWFDVKICVVIGVAGLLTALILDDRESMLLFLKSIGRLP